MLSLILAGETPEKVAETASTYTSKIIENAWIVPALPVAAFFVILFFGRRMPRRGHEIGVPAVFLSLLYSLVVVVQVWGKHADVLRTYKWFDIGQFRLEAAMRVDGLAAMMLVVVTFVSLMVQ